MFYLNEQEKQEEISVYKKAKYYIAKKNRQACLAIFCVKNIFCLFTNFSWQTSVKSDKITVSQIFFSLQ